MASDAGDVFPDSDLWIADHAYNLGADACKTSSRNKRDFMISWSSDAQRGLFPQQRNAVDTHL